MRLPGWAWLALSSLLLAPLEAATRPRYGGTLTLDLSAAWSSLEPAEIPATLALEIAETLVSENLRGDLAPLLAVNWQHDADRKRWRFSLRPKVLFHDGELLTAANVAPALRAALKKKYGDVTITAGGQTLSIQSEHAMPDLLTELARPRSAIFRMGDRNTFIATGPFRVSAWEPGRKLTLAAFDDYWAGRAYLDSVVINMGGARGRADVFDVPFSTTRRVLPEGTRIWTSPPREMIALLAPDVQPIVRRALALSIDRAPIVNVLTQRKGEAAFGLLPQWLSGYAFLFAGSPDVARAKELIAQLRLTTFTLTSPPNDAFARSVADRIALNARDAGISVQLTQSTGANLTLVRWPLESTDAATELARIAAIQHVPDRAVNTVSTKPDSLYEAERSLLEDQAVIPLVYLPGVYGLAPRVHDWEAAHKRYPLALHLESVWVDP